MTIKKAYTSTFQNAECHVNMLLANVAGVCEILQQSPECLPVGIVNRGINEVAQVNVKNAVTVDLHL